ncbi:MAG TPA: alpha/beta hydrolase [Acidimicrobiales bacterium]|nr:alpha/beta hydrolase [Acidimicrobiales bacterium]
MRTPAETRAGAIRLAGGRTLAYTELGDLDGAPVLYCHGGLSSSGDIGFAHGAFAQRGLRVIAPDRPGTGDSTRHMPRRVADWAADAAGLCDVLGVGEFAALGWSAGGPYALACGAGLGPRVRLVATVGGMAPLGGDVRAAQLGLAADRLLFPMARRASAAARAVVWASTHAPVRVLHRQLVKHLPPADEAVVAAMTPTEATADLTHAVRRGCGGVVDDYVVLGAEWGFALEDVTCPVAVLQGAQDTLLPMAHARALAGGLPTGELVVVPEAGHFLLHTATGTVLDRLAG